MLDVSADNGWLVTALRITQVIQMVVQGRWNHDNSLLTLPNIQPYHLYCLRPKTDQGAKKKGFPDIKAPVDCLPQMLSLCDGRFEVLQAMLGEEMNRQQLDQVIKHSTELQKNLLF
ncbi:hypothetical protein KUTeg_010541 [Tegillarca granosa]|uniref:Uncharacterized protein n=1 Tax=Tegillarca granosa TaxID=220873 RepID=A0ABQ9F7S1_TEGGR|nr:hypothetical protein KUTeg_010541 [Tegillarca granosa]